MKSVRNPILIIDRDGLIGKPLCLKLAKEFSVVFVSQRSLNLVNENQSIIYTPFLGKIPTIPDRKYSHIIFIDEEGQDLELLPSLIKKTKEVNSDLIFAQGLLSREKKAGDKILQHSPSAKIVFFGDTFGKEIIFRKEKFQSTANKFLYQTQRFGKIQILGDGLKEVYPVFLDDVVNGLIDLTFGMHKTHSLFYIFPKHVTELSLAHMIQKANPEITVDFVKHNPRLGKITYPPNGKNLLDDKYPLAQKIRRIDIKKKIKVGSEASANTKKIKSFHFFAIWILTFLLFSPLIFTILFSTLGLSAFYYAKGEMGKGNFANVKSSLRLSRTFFYLGREASNALFLEAKVIGLENKLKRLVGDIDLGYKISEALSQAFNSGDYFLKVFNGKSKNPKDDFTKGKNILKSSIISLNRLKAEEKIPAPISQSLESISPLLSFLSNIENILPNIFGMEGPKTYLILFQNNTELRPGGGVIDSYGILKFNLGKITELSIHDIHDADQQLRGHVEPPFAVRRYLPSEHWYMKDSNFDVDFVKSSSSSSNFLLVTTGQKADGVIAIDTIFLKSILHAIGSSDENFPSDLMKRKDFLKSVSAGTIITKITKEKASYLLIAQAVSDALAKKHLLLSFERLQNTFTVNGWSSSLWDERVDSERSINDFIGINEANLGRNQVNPYISRKAQQKVTIGDSGNILDELTINYKNESKESTYKNYLRIIVPKDSKLSEISINDKVLSIQDAVVDPLIYEAKNFKAPQGIEIEKREEGNKTIFGFMTEIPAGEIIAVKLKYALNGNVAGLNTFSYSLKLFKQPGIDSIPYSFSLIYPNSFTVVGNSSEITGGKGTVSYTEKIASDKNLVINLVKKQ